LLKKQEWAILPTIKNNERESSYHLYPLRINNESEEERDLIIEHISLKGISVNVHFIPVPMMSYYKVLNYNIVDYPNAYNYYKAEISLPVFYDLKLHQVEEIVRALNDAVKMLHKSRM
jgi:dTDP-4-amino-4,6-dideoxygalactose transaminase